MGQHRTPGPIDEDPDRIVEMVDADQIDELRALLTESVKRYGYIHDGSDIVRSIKKASAELEERPYPHEAFFELMSACPHPFVNCWGYCDCCGSDRSMSEDPTADAAIAAALAAGERS